MDTFRRRSHRYFRVVENKRQADALADLLARVLRQYYLAFSDVYEHPCESCGCDVAIYIRKARELGVTIDLSA